MLVDLPNELLQIIAGYLDPCSLSSLSRSHTCFRELTRKSVSCQDLLIRLVVYIIFVTSVVLAGQSQLWTPYVTEEPSLLLSAARDCLADILKLPPQVMDFDSDMGSRVKANCNSHKNVALVWT